MNAITRWDPFKELDELQNRLSTLFGRAPIRKNGSKDEALAVAEWAPVVDIVEDDNEYLIKAELPEVKKDDVKVTVQDDVLTISGERMFEKEEKRSEEHTCELQSRLHLVCRLLLEKKKIYNILKDAGYIHNDTRSSYALNVHN